MLGCLFLRGLLLFVLVVLDDGNMRDEDLIYGYQRLANAPSPQRYLGRAILQLLATLSPAQRDSWYRYDETSTIIAARETTWDRPEGWLEAAEPVDLS